MFRRHIRLCHWTITSFEPSSFLPVVILVLFLLSDSVMAFVSCRRSNSVSLQRRVFHHSVQNKYFQRQHKAVLLDLLPKTIPDVPTFHARFVPRGGGSDGGSGRRKSPLTTGSMNIVTRMRMRNQRRVFSRNFATNDNNNNSDDNNVESRKSRRITFVTDVEGDRDYMTRFIDMSKIMCFRPITEDDKEFLQSNGIHFPYMDCIDFLSNRHCKDIFVFGGDTWDQGGSDLWVIRQLLFLKLRYPDCVYLIIGNRDGNKMRVVHELGVADPMPLHKGVYWLKGTDYPGNPDDGPFPTNQTSVERLQWMLRYTMGSPRAFNYRKWELQQERIAAIGSEVVTVSDTVTDEDVVESYRNSCHPITGEMGKYLSNANLFVRLGEVAFVHGGLPLTPKYLELQERKVYRENFWDDMAFAMPWVEKESSPTEAISTYNHNVLPVDAWIESLNRFATDCVESWRAEFQDLDRLATRSMWSWTGGYHAPNVPKFTQLIQYGMGMLPDRTPNPTVVYNGWRHFLSDDDNTDDDSEEDIFVRQTQNFMVQTGIRLICCGHQPQGDMPNAIRVHLPQNLKQSAWIVSADTSYSGDTSWINLPDDDTSCTRKNVGRGDIKSGRGPVAVSEVLIEQCVESGKILDTHFHGTLSDGTQYKSHSLDFDDNLPDGSNADSVVGKIARGSKVPSMDQSPHGGVWWTRAAFESDNSLMLVARKGFDVWNHVANR